MIISFLNSSNASKSVSANLSHLNLTRVELGRAVAQMRAGVERAELGAVSLLHRLEGRGGVDLRRIGEGVAGKGWFR